MPLLSLIDDKKRIFIERDIPELNIFELIVRNLIHIRQITEMPDIDEETAEGQIAFVTVQLLEKSDEKVIQRSMQTYYESTKNISGTGYRKLTARQGIDKNPFKT